MRNIWYAELTENYMQPCLRIEEPALDKTERLLEQILLPILTQEARVRFLCDAGDGNNVAARVRVMLSRKRKQLQAKGKKLNHFRLHSSIHTETHGGKRFDCLIMWRTVNENHIMTQELEDLLSNG
jgi:hypothetical protein